MSFDDAPTRAGTRPGSTEHALLIAAEKLRLQYRNMPTAIAGSMLICGLMGFALAQAAGVGRVLTWMVAVYAWALARFIQWRAFLRINPGAQSMGAWRAMSIGGSGLAGLIWGIGALYLDVAHGLAHQLFLVMGIVGMGAGSVYASASLMPSFFAFFYPSILLPAGAFLLQSDSLHFTLGVLLLAFLAIMTPFALRLSRLMDESIRLRFENVRLIDQLRCQKEAADEANVAKSRFLAVASHDLRQPLHALGLFVEALQETQLATRERQVITNIRRSVDAMEELFNSLLDISRLDAGIVQPLVATIPLNMVFDRVRFEYAQIARQKRLSLQVMKTSVYVKSDPALLARLIRNLLSNALYYTDQGGVVLGCRRNGKNVRIEVWDTGKGIPADQHAEIFREFVQIGNPERDRRRGLGLGLAIVERLAKLLNHEVGLRSVLGKGSVFSITLPRGTREEYQPEEFGAESVSFDLAQAFVLVIDDEAVVQEGMAALLRKWDCDVLTAGSGAQMLAKLVTAQRVPDLIVSDYRLEGAEDGIQVIEMLRSEFNADIPALLVTGDTDPDRLREAEVSGLPILHKPLNPARLRTLIVNLLRAHTQAA